MEITFNSMDDDRWWSYDGPVLLLIDNTIHEATLERGRSWFYLYNNCNFEGKEGLEDTSTGTMNGLKDGLSAIWRKCK